MRTKGDSGRRPAGAPATSHRALRNLRRRAAEWMQASRWDSATEAWRSILDARPGDIDALGNLALIAKECGRLEESEALWKEAIQRYPKNAGLWGNLAEVHRLRLQPGQAETVLRHALSLAPRKTDLHVALATTLWEQRKIAPALEAADEIPSDAPEAAAVANLRGNILSHIGDAVAARKAYRRALELKPGHAVHHSNYLLSLLYDDKFSAGELIGEHRTFGQAFAPAPAYPAFDADPGRRLRLGFFSSDFRMHSVAFFLAPLVRGMDRGRFEVHLFSGVRHPDDMTRLLRSHADRFHAVAGMPPDALEALCREEKLDIAIDLAGHTGGNFLPAFARRLAPLQGSWLGYPHSTGLRSLDFRLSDSQIEPLPESQAFSSEPIVHIPKGAHCYRMPGEEIPVSALPMRSRGAATFICCNNSAKITAAMLDLWARLLAMIPGSRLILKNGGFSYPPKKEAVLAHFAAAGVEPSRVEIRPLAASIHDHLQMYHEADVALDTYPYHGTTTTCEALWMGLPVVSLAGTEARSRHGVSLLQQAGLDDWVVDSEEAYLQRVLSAVADGEQLAQLRRGLRSQVTASPLGHSASFSLRFQSSLRRLWAQRCTEEGVAEGDVDEAFAEADQLLLRGEAILELDRGRQQAKSGRVAGAEACWRRAGESGHAPAAWILLARSLEERGEAEGAHEAWSAAVRELPERAEVWAGFAESCRSIGDISAATEAYERIVEMVSDKPGIWMNLSALYRSLRRPIAAEEAARRSIELNTDFPEAWNNLGGALRDQARFEEAVEAYCKALELRPGWAEAHSNLVYLLNFVPGLSAEDLRTQHAVYDAQQLQAFAGSDNFRAERGGSGQRPLRVGFLSPDLRDHSVSHFLRAALRALAEREVELRVFSDCARPDAVTESLRPLCENWHEVGSFSDSQLLERLRACELDVLVELSGHTAGNRLPMLAQRAAPTQLSWLGYPTALECRAVDGFVSDHFIYPEGEETPESVWRLKLCAFPYAPAEPERMPDPIGEGPLIFGAFHGLTKLHEEVWQAWIRLLQEIPEARLKVKSPQLSEDRLLARLKEQLASWGAPVKRIEWLAYRAESRSHRRLYDGVDIALDPWPYNGVTTTLEALCEGVPVLSLEGKTPAGRHSSSLQRQFGALANLCGDSDALVARAKGMACDLLNLRAQRIQRRREAQDRCRVHAGEWADEFLAALKAAHAQPIVTER